MAMTKQSMADRIEAAVAAVGAVQTSDPAAALVYRRQIIEAFCQGVIEEVVANSELVPVTTDSGTAGAGIITGKVK